MRQARERAVVTQALRIQIVYYNYECIVSGLWATEADLYLSFVSFFVANAKGNMQRRLTSVFVSFCVGFCAGSSFPSNINIGEYSQHGMLIISLLRPVGFTSKLLRNSKVARQSPFVLFCNRLR